MAKTWGNTKLKLVYLTDVETAEGSGKFKTKSKTYANVEKNASAEDLYEVGASIASLQTYELTKMEQIDTYELSE